MTIMLVEDDRDLAQTIIDYLELESIPCDYADNGVSALGLIQQNTYQVVVLDINLPRMDGFSVCEKLRAAGNDTPVIMLTAKDQLEDKLTGFKAGADDYLVKPFAMDELVARIRALSGRMSRQIRKLTVSDLSLDLDQNVVTRGNVSINLSPTGFKLLEALMRSSPKAVSKEELITSVWGDEGSDSNSLKVHIHKLRKDVDCGNNPPLIHTVKAFGYVLRADNAD